MGHSIHIYDDVEVAGAAGVRDCAIDERDRTGDVSFAQAVAGDNSCQPQPEVPEESPDVTSPPSTDGSKERAPRRRIFLLLTLALVAAPLAEAALPGAAEPIHASRSWESHVQGVAHRDRDGLPVDLGGETAPGWLPPVGALGHRRDRSEGPESQHATTRSLCSVDIDVTASPPTLSVRTSLAGVPLPEIHVTLGSLARVLLDCRAP